ncbi:integrase arm-type DNA-binding domain-containing protein [Sphingomonas sp. IC-11]|uniref:tyrosine-type recombinase/integrase n=1 Tax=Sphingomonas sp. IC-11 TaxID=2898528 RepID=UPI001E4DD94B|nr:integrase arm-type DNA-binding domain-containing protein [Sphingomonas sp. IC-11]MCD2316388.1 integrase arm-type DNA-binding domain-containing protein [Sphingomonas sp. IC-11]
MPLTDTAVRTAKPGLKPRKIADEKGLFLLIQPSGGKLWRLKYRYLGKEKKLSLGCYPDVTLKAARDKRDEARRLIAEGVDPSVEKRARHLAAQAQAANTFGVLANEYIDKQEREGRSSATISKARWLLSLMEQPLGKQSVDSITPAILLAALKLVEDKGHHETARRMRSLASRVFRYAVATARGTGDPAAALQGALTKSQAKHHAAIVDPAGVGALLRAIDGYDGQPMTRLALSLAPLVYVRPGELRTAEWSEFDLDAAVWRIPASKMKMGREHVVPLARQALAILASAKVLTGKYKHVFASMYPGTRPMSENTLNAALRRLGYSGDEMVAHGFRTMASSLLNESGKWHPDAIERSLAHCDKSVIRGTYHRGAHWKERVEMAQWWADYLDELRANIR